MGITSGLLAAFGLSRYVSGMLFGLTPVDPLTYAAVAAAFTAVAMAASYVPAPRAMRITTLVALRYE
jgi:hypothetical protein